jgi:hypothetical protein
MLSAAFSTAETLRLIRASALTVLALMRVVAGTARNPARRRALFGGGALCEFIELRERGGGPDLFEGAQGELLVGDAHF